MLNQRLYSWARDRNYRVACINPGCAGEVRGMVDELRNTGAIDPVFFQEWLNEFRYVEDCTIQPVSALVLIAVPRPAHIVTFDVPGRILDMVLPPTYVNYRRTFEMVRDDFLANVVKGKDGVEILNVPIKTLAGLVGFIRYGKNNVGYVPGYGSYVQLVCLATTYPFELEPADKTGAIDRHNQMLEECRDCKRCVQACTMGAIPEDRFLLRAQSCYTAFSESAKPIPQGLHSPSPQCLIGCMKCQLSCPVNRGLLKYEKVPEQFTKEESQYMLNARVPYQGEIWSRIITKFAKLGLTEQPPLFVRNLQLIHGSQG